MHLFFNFCFVYLEVSATVHELKDIALASKATFYDDISAVYSVELFRNKSGTACNFFSTSASEAADLYRYLPTESIFLWGFFLAIDS